MTEKTKKIVKTRRELARECGVSIETVRAWISKGVPMTPTGRFNVAAVKSWHSARQSARQLAMRGDPTKKAEELEERIRWRKAKADLAELELHRRRGKLVDREEVIAERITQIIVVKYALLGIPNMAPQLTNQSAREIQVILREKVVDIINGFAGENSEES